MKHIVHVYVSAEERISATVQVWLAAILAAPEAEPEPEPEPELVRRYSAVDGADLAG